MKQVKTEFYHYPISSKVYCLITKRDERYKGRCCDLCRLKFFEIVEKWVVAKRTITNVDFRCYPARDRLLYGVSKNKYTNQYTLGEEDVFEIRAEAMTEAKKRNDARAKPEKKIRASGD